MYKVLYLPLGEEVLINANFMNAFVAKGLRAWESSWGLAMPRLTQINRKGFKIAKFETKATAQDWVIDLINRPSCRDANMRLEHFEFIEI
jgi:hypothetical protein